MVKGRHYTEESKQKNREAHLGKKASEETKRKMSDSRRGIFKGRVMSVEWINKVREGNKRFWNSLEGKSFARGRRARQIFPKYDTKTELKIQGFLTGLNISFVTHKYMNIEHGYQCDIFVPSLNLVIECDGCWFHACPKCHPKNKFEYRKELDEIRTKELQERDYKVLRLWEYEIKTMNIGQFERKISERLIGNFVGDG